MSNEKKISIEKVISDIKESNGKRKGCHGLHQCLSDDGYIRQIVCWTRITSPDRIDALVEHADKQNAEITALRTALTALTSQLESVVAENAAQRHLLDMIGETGNANLGRTLFPIPATSAFLAEVRASGVEMFALMYAEEALKSGSISIGWRARASKAASEYAAQLRQGGAV